MNRLPWEKVSCHFDLATAQGTVRYTSDLTPAAQLKLGQHNIFPTDYRGQGIASGSTKNTEHATNLWVSEFHADDGKPLFRGVRHGICSPYGLKNNSARAQGAQNRAREVATAALFLDKSKLQKALDGETVNLRLSSTSLVTAINFAGRTEGKQFADQLKAWQALSRQNPCILPIKDASGTIKNVKVNLEVAAFNFGVNEAALKLLKLGWTKSDKQNEQALKTLFGEDLSPQGREAGWVGEYLNAKPAHSNAQVVAQLSSQIRDIWNEKTHHSDGGEPYKLAQRIALLSNEIGIVPCYNCKSGKDRTGMLDSEVKREVVELHRGAGLSPLDTPLTPEKQHVFREVLLNSGNLEIQLKNTGAPGNKVLRKLSAFGNNLSLHDRIGEQAAFNSSAGLSALVKS